MTDLDLEAVVAEILAARGSVPAARSALVAVTGIDGCGKGYVTARLVDALRMRGARAVSLNIDGWLNLPAVRFSENYFPAQEIHLERDDPRPAATARIDNDQRLGAAPR